jgi:hypothetical protein
MPNMFDINIGYIQQSKEKANHFFDSLFVPEKGFKNSQLQHEDHTHLYLNGTWATVLGKRLINSGENWMLPECKDQAIRTLLSHKQRDGMIYPSVIMDVRSNKSHEYLKLHCNNYATGAMLELQEDYDVYSSYLNKFLNPDFMAHWLDGISFLRPWEESNNIVNVASYLSILSEKGDDQAIERLYQMFEWHEKFQNPLTGGFDSLPVQYKFLKQSMAGAVHNFHIHLNLKQPIRYSEVINDNVCSFLTEGPLSACMSIDYSELAIRTLNDENSVKTYAALSAHVGQLLRYQNQDGGWFESANPQRTSFEGLKETAPSSSSYSSWFRLCSIGMFSIVFLNDNIDNWTFRRTLGMGYAPRYWPEVGALALKKEELISALKKSKKRFHKDRLKERLINLGLKVLKL